MSAQTRLRQAIRRRIRDRRAVSTTVFTAGAALALAFLWMGLNTVGQLTNTRAVLDPLAQAALGAGLIGDSADGTSPAYTMNPPGTDGSGTFTVSLTALADNMQAYLTHQEPGSTLPPCPTVAGLSSTVQQGMLAACTNHGFAWSPPPSWAGSDLLAGPIVFGNLQAASSNPYTVTLFGTAYAESGPVLGAEAWIPVHFALDGVGVTTVIQEPVVVPAAVTG